MNRWGLTPHIARHEIKLVGGNEETVRGLTALARCIFQDEVLAGGPGNLALNHLDVTPDAVLLMHDIVTDLQGKRIDRPPAPRRHLAHVLHRCTLSEDVLLGDDAEPYPREPEPHRDPSGRHGDDPRRRRIRDVVDEAARDVLSGEGLSESLSGSMALAQKHDALARSGPGGDVGECCRGVPPVGLQGRTAEIDDGLVMCFGIDRERGYLPPLPIRPHARRPNVIDREIARARQVDRGLIADSGVVPRGGKELLCRPNKVVGTAPDPLGVKDDHARIRRHHLKQGRHPVSEDRGERLHPLDTDTLRELITHVREHRNALCQPPSSLANNRGEEQLADRGGEHPMGREFERPLVRDGETADLLDRVPPEFDPQGVLVSRWKEVQNSAAHRELAPSLDEINTVITHVDETSDGDREIGGGIGRQANRLDITEPCGHRLEDSPDGCHDDIHRWHERVRGVGVCESPQDGYPPADRVGRGRKSLMRQCFPRREHHDMLTGQQGTKARRNVLGLTPRRRDDEERRSGANWRRCCECRCDEWLKGGRGYDQRGAHTRPARNLSDLTERRRIDDSAQKPREAHELAACARLSRRATAMSGCETTRSVTYGGIWLKVIARPSTCEASYP